MPLRLLEVVVPENQRAETFELLKDAQSLGLWQEGLSEDRVLFRLLLPAEYVESLTDEVEKHVGSSDGFRTMLFSVEATMPRPDEPDSVPQEPAEEEPAKKPSIRVSREEMYETLSTETRLTTEYRVRDIASTAAAAVGLMQGDIAIVIGAMVIAPLIGPNMSLSLATTLGDGKLARRSLYANSFGILLSLALASVIGLLFTVDSTIPIIATRTEIGIEHIVIALASGVVGALAYTRGVPAALVGVMISVALLPPLVVAGLLLGSGDISNAIGALMLVATNIICINLAGVATFLVQGVRPNTWWEADKARRASIVALSIWIALLAILVALLLSTT